MPRGFVSGHADSAGHGQVVVDGSDGADPSPTADATRFMEPDRTSPTAKTPEQDVSNGRGSRPAKNGSVPSGQGPIGRERTFDRAQGSAQPRRCGLRTDEAEQRRRPGPPALPVGVCSRRPVRGGNRRGEPGPPSRSRTRCGDPPRCGRPGAATWVGQVGPADRDRDPATLLAEVDRRLSGGIPTADNQDVGLAQPGLRVGGGVVDAVALESLEVGDRQALVAGAGGDDDRPGRGSRSGRQGHDVEPVLDAEPGDLAGAEPPRPETLGLDSRRAVRSSPDMPLGNPA